MEYYEIINTGTKKFNKVMIQPIILEKLDLNLIVGVLQKTFLPFLLKIIQIGFDTK